MNAMRIVSTVVLVLGMSLLLIGCSGKVENFPDVRDYIMKESGEQYRTNIELALDTDNLGILKNHIEDLDLDTESYSISNIRKIEFGVYNIEGDRTIDISRYTDGAVLEKLNKRLHRAGYETVVQKREQDELSLLVIKEVKRNQTGALYFAHVKPAQFILVKVDGRFQKL
jgi:hypothetical protein